jgi:NADH-quinone oxidoreductase subunit J
VHAVLLLIFSFLGTALLFALLGAPMLAAFQVIVYAGGIMVLFLFVVMMLRGEPGRSGLRAAVRRVAVPAVFGLGVLAVSAFLVASDPARGAPLPVGPVSPRDFGRIIFSRYALAVEVASLLLFVALVGALHLGRQTSKPSGEPE